jgi:hypothetical protein
MDWMGYIFEFNLDSNLIAVVRRFQDAYYKYLVVVDDATRAIGNLPFFVLCLAPDNANNACFSSIK